MQTEGRPLWGTLGWDRCFFVVFWGVIHLDMAVLRRPIHRGRILRPAPRVDVSPALQQQRDDRHVAVERGQPERGGAVLRPVVHLVPRSEQLRSGRRPAAGLGLGTGTGTGVGLRLGTGLWLRLAVLLWSTWSTKASSCAAATALLQIQASARTRPRAGERTSEGETVWWFVGVGGWAVYGDQPRTGGDQQWRPQVLSRPKVWVETLWEGHMNSAACGRLV